MSKTYSCVLYVFGQMIINFFNMFFVCIVSCNLDTILM